MRKSSKVLLAAMFSMVVAGVSVTVPASAGPLDPVGGTGGTDQWMQEVGAEFLAKQDALMDFTGWINQLPDVENDGYVAPVFDTGAKSITLLWKGKDTVLQRKVMREGTTRGITVTVKPYRFSVRQIQAAQQRIWDAQDNGRFNGFTITEIVGVTGAEDRGLEIDAVAPAAAKVSDVQTLATGIAGMPVTVRTDIRTEPAYTRSTDYRPFNAGGYMIDAGNHVCSSGFAIVIGATSHTTTARHCRSAYHSRSANGSINQYGSTTQYSTDGAARVLSASGSAQMFDGAWNNPDGYRKPVQELRDVGINTLVCTSGGNSGVHCNVKVTSMWASWNDGFGSVSNIRGVQQTSGRIAVIQGDSGGPVLIPYSNGKVGAVGMIQALENGFTGSGCGSVHDLGSNQCSRTVLFTSMRTIVNHVAGSYLLTG